MFMIRLLFQLVIVLYIDDLFTLTAVHILYILDLFILIAGSHNKLL